MEKRKETEGKRNREIMNEEERERERREAQKSEK
jgi:hypothetical protein